MNDADNNNTDHDAKVDQGAGLSKTEYAKPTKNTRTSDIYKRFLNRVKSIDSDNNDDNVTINLESLEKFKESSTYEPLNEEELHLFTDYEQEIDSNESDFTSIDISFSNDDERINYEGEVTDLSELSADNESTHDNDNLAPETETNSGTNSSTKKTSTLWGKPVGNGKLLITGGFCGLLLSALIVVTLNATGFLAASTNNLAPNSIQTISTNTLVANSEQATNENTTTKVDPSNVDNTNLNNSGTAISTKTSSSDTLSADATTNDSKLEMDNTKTVSSEELPAQPASKQNEVKNNSTDNITKNSAVTGIDISPEDFREEAQSTLYRETTD